VGAKWNVFGGFTPVEWRTTVVTSSTTVDGVLFSRDEYAVRKFMLKPAKRRKPYVAILKKVQNVAAVTISENWSTNSRSHNVMGHREEDFFTVSRIMRDARMEVDIKRSSEQRGPFFR
jgi:hypothetical protein